MCRLLPISLTLAALGCGSDVTSATDATDASTGGADTETSESTDTGPGTTETDSGTETETETDSETGEPEDPELPELVGDNCEVEVRWSTYARDTAEELYLLETAGPGAFVVGGRSQAAGLEVLSIADGQLAWSHTYGPPTSNPLAELTVLEDGTIIAHGGVGFGRTLVYSSAGEVLNETVQVGRRWRDVVRDGGQLHAVGQGWTDFDDGDTYTTALGRFDEFGDLIETLEAPTIGITMPSYDWASELFVEGDQVWVSGWEDGRCAVLIEYDSGGIEQWWECTIMGLDGEGEVEAMVPLGNGNLLIAGDVRTTKNGWEYTEPVAAAVTRQGQVVWEWRNGQLSTFAGTIWDVAVVPGGGFLAAIGERDLTGPNDNDRPVIMQRDDDGEFVARCTFERPGVDPEWRGELNQVALGDNGEIYVLLAENISFDEYWYSVVEVLGL